MELITSENELLNFVLMTHNKTEEAVLVVKWLQFVAYSSLATYSTFNRWKR